MGGQTKFFKATEMTQKRLDLYMKLMLVLSKVAIRYIIFYKIVSALPLQKKVQ